ncbi:hypothetical protein BEP19_06990 [Ammoniphilus oxalaticus]|uniref:Serine/threonine-protein kinase PrkC n=1 Tax=Ammoniphilus oxalaticus TaxID=66863 RepID=A0A419SJI7_9BACL|nr:Stk1 family PASTA domain-containing Ser/Thr kinase [Ammoniphilus oxalaticus]RKD24147.1 hypothetical protein BEP19_06990 [Ammoniphilus oxalaticus]
MIGRRLGGRYEVKQRVGGGGMAVVYKAHDNLLNRTVALKILRSQFGHDDDFITRFRREAQAAASLSHANVVNVYDVGVEDDIQYIVMEYVEGQTLKELIIDQGALPVEQAVEIAMQICDALEHAHHNHIIHRDIKPHNILMGKNGRVKVTDFGIARAVSSATITHTGSVIGSVHYFSPEQARGGISGEKSDIYSLGIVLYEMITGSVPFSGDSPISVALKHLQEEIIAPREINPSLPQSLENVVLRALVKDPLYRYQSAREMQLDLKTCLNLERLNEPKFVVEHDDEEATRMVPAITPAMLREHEMSMKEDEAEQEEQVVEDGDSSISTKQRPKWVKPASWTGFITLLIIALIYSFNLLIGMIYVPELVMPSVEGMPLEEAQNELIAKGLKPVVHTRPSDEIPENEVIRQSPPADMRVKKNSEVILIVSQGEKEVMMPKMIAESEELIEELLGRYNPTIERKSSDEYAAGIIMAQQPPEGEMFLPSGTDIIITVSRGKETVRMPTLIGLKVREAENLLRENGLKRGKIKEEPSYMEKGTVFRQYPFQPGSQASPGTEIELGVSSGYPSEAKTVTEPVLVLVDDEPTDIRIVVTDARGKNRELIKKTIQQSDTFDVEVVVSPTQDGTIMIYKNGEFIERRPVPYEDVS